MRTEAQAIPAACGHRPHHRQATKCPKERDISRCGSKDCSGNTHAGVSKYDPAQALEDCDELMEPSPSKVLVPVAHRQRSTDQNWIFQ